MKSVDWGKIDSMNGENKARGFTLIEIMICGGLLGMIAVALLPAFSRLITNSVSNSFRLSCASIVRAKMQEYVSGVSSSTSSTFNQVVDGFQYSKYRYQNVTNSCIASPSSTPGTPGFRENSGNNTVVAAASATEATLPLGMKGFQLWVNLRRYNPRNLVSGNPERDCPSATGTDQYQFLRVGDAIEVTVTGMIRTTAAAGDRNGAAYGGVSDVNATTPNPKLTCSLTQLVYPDKKLYRYYLTNDGRLVNTQLNEPLVAGVTKGGNVTASALTHFRNLWSTVPGAGGTVSSPTFGGLKGIAVSPNNDRVYVLKSSEILVYTGCTDQQVVVSGFTFNGIPNCSGTPTYRFNVLPLTINDIAVDFNDSIAGAYTTQNDIIYAIRSGGPAGSSALLKYTMPAGAPAATERFADDNNATGGYSGTGGYTLLTNSRITSIFIAPSFPLETPRKLPALFYANRDCYTDPTGSGQSSTFCATIYNATDQSFSADLSDALSSAIDFSN